MNQATKAIVFATTALNTHLNIDGLDGELVWTWNNGRSCGTNPGWDICIADPLFNVLPKY